MDLARIVNAVEAGTLTVVEAVPLPANATADLFEALRSDTTRTTPDTVILSASTAVDDELDDAAVAVLSAALARLVAAPISRRAAAAITPNAASAGTVGVPPLRALDNAFRRLVSDAARGTVAIGGDTTRAAAAG